MYRNTLIYVTDKRQKYLSEILPGKEKIENDVFSKGGIDRIILPTPVSKLEKYPMEEEKLMNYLDISKGIVTVYGGKFTPKWKNYLEKSQIPYVDLMEDEIVAIKNAAITAEAVVALVISQGNYSIDKSKFVITGFGRCAKAVADKISNLGGKVTILARKRQARKEAKENGYYATDFSYGPEECEGCQVLINTVPDMVVNENMIKELPKDSIIIDIASSPGGCDLEAVKKYKISYKLALGLPGIYTPKSSSKVLAEAIRRHSYYEQKIGENKGWIYQIVL